PRKTMSGERELTLGVVLIIKKMFSLAIINVLTKKVATISGLAFTIAFSIFFECSEIYNRIFSNRGRHTRFKCDWSSDVCSSDLFSASARKAGSLTIAAKAVRRISTRSSGRSEERRVGKEGRSRVSPDYYKK